MVSPESDYKQWSCYALLVARRQWIYNGSGLGMYVALWANDGRPGSGQPSSHKA